MMMTLVVVPDLFMTLEMLQLYLAPLLTRHPFASVLLVGLVGLPNTVWPKDITLDMGLHSLCLKSLLTFLNSNRILVSNSSNTDGDGDRD